MARVLRIILLILLAFGACLVFPRRATEAEEPAFMADAGLLAQPQDPKAPRATSPRGAKRAAAPARKTSSSVQSLRNIGKAYYEQAKYVEAIEEFKKVIASGSAVATDHLNLGLALMQAGKLNDALASFTTAKQIDPKLVPVDYNLGILYKRELRYPDAEASLRRVIEADPRDPAAWFNLGTVYFAQRKLEEALQAHGHVVEMGFGQGQNFYVASLFHSFTTLVRLKRQEEAQKFLKMHESMRDAVPGISLQNSALEGGKYGAVLVPSSPLTTVARRAATANVSFSDVTARLGIAAPAPSASLRPEALPGVKSDGFSLEYARRELQPRFGPYLAVGDLNQDGQPDMYIANPAGGSRLYQNNGDGSFTDVTEKFGLPESEAAFSAVFVDHNNGACTSLLVTGDSGVHLYRAKGDGNGKCDGVFVDDTDRAGLRGKPGELTTAAAFFDGDNDGFLDLLVARYADLNSLPHHDPFTFPNDFQGGGVRFYRNNADGTFTDRTSHSGFGSVPGRVRKILFGDFDNDGYTDAVILRDDAAPLIYFGKGECRFVNRTAETGNDFVQTVAVDGAVTDFNHDGYFDLALWSPAGYQVLINRGGGRFAEEKGLPSITPPIGVFAFRGTVADVDGDSFDDLILVDSDGKWHWLANRAGKFREEELTLPEGKTGSLGAFRATWLSTAGKLNLVAVARAGNVTAFEKDGPASRWLEVRMTGFKSNTLGIGSVVELKAGNFYNKLLVNGDRVRVYTGDLPRLDVVRVTWPNAVVQNWVNVSTDKPMEVRESERLASSCPFLYVWNGREFEYVTDVLGVAPLGHLLPSGGYVRPNPEELVRLGDQLQPRNGRYVFQLTDELREVDYFDQVRLLAVDHPASEEVYSNEVFLESLGSPTLHTVKQHRAPGAARDQDGRDVLPLVRTADKAYVSGFRRLGIPGLASEHALELDLGKLDPAAPVALYLRGWVYWTDSNSHRALVSNRSTILTPPYLQVRDVSGAWKTVIEDMGVPSGTDRTMRVDLRGKFLSDRREVRIVTNMCVYWDEAFFTTEEGAAPATFELPLVSADLHYRGFSTPELDPQGVKPEHFDYSKVLAEAPWNPMIGNYTRYGDVHNLLGKADDHLVVMATGDEITVEFDAGHLPPLQPGWKRTYFLYTHGWAKDGEPNTAYSKTVAPLPFRRMSGYPQTSGDLGPDAPDYREYLREYQTRRRYELIPSLAPVQ
ncbi:MAG: VCBS repeat-containing protein [Acidobacteria bacterium]|nr:VCBS repeat-containing protein [Acidobacteriota bacterium]